MLRSPKDQQILFNILLLNYLVLFLQLGFLVLYHTIFDSIYILIPVGIFTLISLVSLCAYAIRCQVVKEVKQNVKIEMIKKTFLRSPHAGFQLFILFECHVMMVLHLINLQFDLLALPWMMLIIIGQFVLSVGSVMLYEHIKSNKLFMAREIY
ncbi:MAG: hypothetical protein WC992_05495 [Acholeplasmataceae bacterium]|jgi:hypothetical protein|nr:hypothetical protein [Acholeplasmataceae bacterium]